MHTWLCVLDQQLCGRAAAVACERGRASCAGIGKSTLLNLISGGLEAVAGHISRNSAVRMATYSQHHMDGLALHLSPLQYFMREFKNEKDERLRSHLSNFGISGDLAMQPMCAAPSPSLPLHASVLTANSLLDLYCHMTQAILMGQFSGKMSVGWQRPG